MPFARPTLKTLLDQAIADVQSVGADAPLRYSPELVLARVVARLANMQYGFLDWISRQSVPVTAELEYLESWGAFKGVFRKAATAASGSVTFPGTNGIPLSSGTKLVLLSSGAELITTTSSTVAGNSVTVQAVMSKPGSAGNVSGAQIGLGTAISGIDSQGLTGQFTGGADQEDDDDFRSRVLFQYANAPQGGDADDYVEWALAVPGVTRAWCLPNGFGPGTVVVYVMFDDANAAFQGLPQGTNGVAFNEPRRGPVATGDQLNVANAIFPLQPVTALVLVSAPVLNHIGFTITGTTGWSAATKAAVLQAIADVLFRVGAPGATVQLSEVESAIAAVTGTKGFVVTSPAGNVSQTPGQLPVLGSVNFT